ncbi:hypothetical protein CesoFtcFv8_027295 [Champsocephalus esox]|uniref:Uncharacterized protein n=1 Tax=Champsocephalus esox TaxID=159716 RepID=A0AAN7Y2W1_9TELE|nr:hypothetical protein CesoFtcFv8_027295 [Champsocephalus esox]
MRFSSLTLGLLPLLTPSLSCPPSLRPAILPPSSPGRARAALARSVPAALASTLPPRPWLYYRRTLARTPPAGLVLSPSRRVVRPSAGGRAEGYGGGRRESWSRHAGDRSYAQGHVTGTARRRLPRRSPPSPPSLAPVLISRCVARPELVVSRSSILLTSLP